MGLDLPVILNAMTFPGREALNLQKEVTQPQSYIVGTALNNAEILLLVV